MEELPQLLGVVPAGRGSLQVVITRIENVPVLAVGAVVEVQGPYRLYLRGDIADNLTWFGDSGDALNPRIVRQNLEFTVGVGWRLW